MLGVEGFMKKSVIIMNPESGKAKKLSGYKEFYDIREINAYVEKCVSVICAEKWFNNTLFIKGVTYL